MAPRWAQLGVLGLAVVVDGSASGPRVDAASQVVPRWSVVEVIRIAEQRGVVDGALWRGAIVVPRYAPPSLTLYDSAGRAVWTRATEQRRPAGLVVVGDTVAILENAGTPEDYQIVRFLAATGRELDRLDVALEPGQSPRLIGWSERGWTASAISLFANRGRGLEALVHAELRILDIDPRTGVTMARYSGIDSTTQTIPPVAFGRSPIRPPFAPLISFAMLPGGDVAASSGDRLTMSVLDASGIATRLLELPQAMPQPVVDRQAQLDVWKRSVMLHERIDTLLRRVAAADTGLRGMTFGRVRSSPDGELLVQRRDLLEHPLESVDSAAFDVVDSRPGANPVVLGRVILNPRDGVLAFDGTRILCIRSEPAGQSALILYRLLRNRS